MMSFAKMQKIDQAIRDVFTHEDLDACVEQYDRASAEAGFVELIFCVGAAPSAPPSPTGRNQCLNGLILGDGRGRFRFHASQ